ncbi:MAG: hypothetical protein V1816_05520 [Pseudomonadota bacterium]
MAWLDGKKTYLAILAALALAFTLILVYSEKGLVGLSGLKAEKARLEKINQDIREENQRLLHKIERIKTDPRDHRGRGPQETRLDSPGRDHLPTPGRVGK